jgi:hypothetical protein
MMNNNNGRTPFSQRFYWIAMGVATIFSAIWSVYIYVYDNESGESKNPKILNGKNNPATEENTERASIMVGKTVKLRQSNNVNSIVLCDLRPSDYIMPLDIVNSTNNEWCLVSVVDSQVCIVKSEGYIPSVVLPGSCGF